VSNRDGVFGAGLDYWHTGPSHLLNLKLALMLFARYTIAQACWCTRPWAMPDSCRCSEEQELARPLKRELSCTALTPTPQGVTVCRNCALGAGAVQRWTCTWNWGATGEAIKVNKAAHIYKHSYSHSTCMTSCAALNCSVTSHCVQMLYDQPLCVALKCSMTSHCQLWTLQPHHIRTIQPWMCDLISYKSESSPSALRELPTLAYLPTNMARFQCINSCALCG